MRSVYSKNLRYFWHKNAVLFLLLVYMCGLFGGAHVASTSLRTLTPVLFSVSNSGASAIGLVCVLLIPLLLSVLAVYFSIPAAILPICFFKAFAFGYCSCGILLSFRSAGWLVRLLLLFSDSLMLMPLLWLWLCHIKGSRIRLKRNTMVCLLTALAIGAVDYMYISPLLALLLKG